MAKKEEFLKKYLKVKVVEFKNNVSENPLVSVCVQTYQQVAYIGKCLDGILMQKTNFNFEILLGEDASDDGTRDICIEYAKKFPSKIRLFLHSRENNIKVYGIPTAKFNYGYNIYSSKGKYIAICEGDDFWVDSFKLQKQIDFLEENDDYGLVFSDIIMVNKKNIKIETTHFHKKIISLYKSGNVFWDLMNNNFINTLTVCMRKELILNYIDNTYEEEYTYDYRMWLFAASYSKIKYIDEVWAAYRVHELGISKTKEFFVKRLPLVQQASLIHYMSLISNSYTLVDNNIFSKVAYNILKNRNLTIKEKEPTIVFLTMHPKYLLYMLKWVAIRLFNKFVN